MKKLLTFLSHQKWLLLTVVFFIALMVAVSFISVTQMDGLSTRVLAISEWIKRHHVILLLWHGLILAAIYVGWGMKVNRAVKAQKLSSNEIQRLKRFRWWLIGFVLLVDCWVFWL